jgi:hypothetical protein
MQRTSWARRHGRSLVGLTAGIFALGAASAPAASDAPADATRGAAGPEWHADVEVDPTAYIFNGNSLHVGLGYRRWRLDLGNFGLDLPEFAEPNSGFDASGNGYGLKLQWFPLAEQAGLFVGVEAAVARMNISQRSTGVAATQKQFSSGVNAGYRFSLPADFYVTAWAGLSYAVGARDVAFDGADYEMNPWRVFPAVHMGYQFR